MLAQNIHEASFLPGKAISTCMFIACEIRIIMILYCKYALYCYCLPYKFGICQTRVYKNKHYNINIRIKIY